MKTDKIIYTVYQLNEKVNELGYPYIGFTQNIINRARGWKIRLQLDYTPNLIPLYFSTEENQAFDWEQNKKVEFGWKKELPLNHLRDFTKKAAELPRSKKQIVQAQELGKKQGQKNKQSGHILKIGTFEGRSKGGRKSGSALGKKWGPVNGIKLGKKYGAINGKIAAETYLKEFNKLKAKVTKQEAQKIKDEYNKSEKPSIAKLSKKYSIHFKTIHRIIKGRNGKEYTNFKD